MIGRYWEDDGTWFGDYANLVDESAPTGKPCTSVPCPSFEPAALVVGAICICRDLAPGQLYALGCGVHDPAVVEAR